MQCLGSSVPRGEANIPAATEQASVSGVARFTSPVPARCSFFTSWMALFEDFLRLSPYGDLVFAVARDRPGLSRFRER